MRAYNEEREHKLARFDFSLGDTREEPTFNLDTEVEEAMKLKESCWTGNLQISLFWEEKVVMIIRTL